MYDVVHWRGNVQHQTDMNLCFLDTNISLIKCLLLLSVTGPPKLFLLIYTLRFGEYNLCIFKYLTTGSIKKIQTKTSEFVVLARDSRQLWAEIEGWREQFNSGCCLRTFQQRPRRGEQKAAGVGRGREGRHKTNNVCTMLQSQRAGAEMTNLVDDHSHITGAPWPAQAAI